MKPEVDHISSFETGVVNQPLPPVECKVQNMF